jgi:hypothetical protein
VEVRSWFHWNWIAVKQSNLNKKEKTENMTTLLSRKSIDRSRLRSGFVLFTLSAAFALVPIIQAVTPPPDGGYPGGNTAEGEDALFSLTTGTENTAIGSQALYSNTDGF